MSCGGKRSENRNALFVSMVAEDCRLPTATVRRLFHRLASDARSRKMPGPEADAYARKHLYRAADEEHAARRAAACGGWRTWDWRGEFDEETATWRLRPHKASGIPPEEDWREKYRRQAVEEQRCIRVAVTADPDSGDGYLFTPAGQRIWGLYGASGVLYRAPGSDGTPRYLLAKRASSMGAGGTWGFPGGARGRDEADESAAAREFGEEIGVLPVGARTRGRVVDDVVPGEWSYATVVADVPQRFAYPKPGRDWETTDVRWFTEADLRHAARGKRLHPGLARNLDRVLGAYDLPPGPAGQAALVSSDAPDAAAAAR